MSFASDLSAFYADFAEPVTIAGSAVSAIYSSGYAEALDVATTQPTLRCRAADVAAVTLGAAVVRAGVNYTVRGRQPLPPDELETLLVLERA